MQQNKVREEIINVSNNEADGLLCKALIVGMILEILDFVIKVFKRPLTGIDYLLVGIILMDVIWLWAYKKSKKRELIRILGIMCFELASTYYFIVFWMETMLLWVATIYIAMLYFDKRLLRNLVILKSILFTVSNVMILACHLEITYSTSKNFGGAIETAILQFVIILFFAFLIVKKSNNIFEYSIGQTSNIKQLFEKSLCITKEIGNNIDNLCRGLKENTKAVEEIGTSSSEILAQSNRVDDLVNKSKSNVAEILNENNNAVTKIKEIEILTRESNELVNINKSNISLLQAQINKISNSNADSKKAFSSFVGSIKQISEALNIINTVADETNLLALNASIEAARAGDAGRGFSVVAAQINKLAEQTIRSAQYINGILVEINSSADESMNVLKQTDTIIEKNMDMLSHTQDDFEKMVTLQKNVFLEITNFQDIIDHTEMNAKEVGVVFEQTLEESKKTTENICSITAVIEELNASFQEITSYAENISGETDKFTNTNDMTLTME